MVTWTFLNWQFFFLLGRWMIVFSGCVILLFVQALQLLPLVSFFPITPKPQGTLFLPAEALSRVLPSYASCLFLFDFPASYALMPALTPVFVFPHLKVERCLLGVILSGFHTYKLIFLRWAQELRLLELVIYFHTCIEFEICCVSLYPVIL